MADRRIRKRKNALTIVLKEGKGKDIELFLAKTLYFNLVFNPTSIELLEKWSAIRRFSGVKNIGYTWDGETNNEKAKKLILEAITQNKIIAHNIKLKEGLSYKAVKALKESVAQKITEVFKPKKMKKSVSIIIETVNFFREGKNFDLSVTA